MPFPVLPPATATPGIGAMPRPATARAVTPAGGGGGLRMRQMDNQVLFCLIQLKRRLLAITNTGVFLPQNTFSVLIITEKLVVLYS